MGAVDGGMASSRAIGLVSCVKGKRDTPAPPKDLYTSAYFEKMRAYAERHHDEWYILSAKHGVLDPNGEPIPPYEETLSGAPKATRAEWSETVAGDLRSRGMLESKTTFVFHAGRDYYDELLPLIRGSGVTIEIPTEGLRIGEKLAWYDARL